jgi:hypothetical protein
MLVFVSRIGSFSFEFLTNLTESRAIGLSGCMRGCYKDDVVLDPEDSLLSRSSIRELKQES